MDGFQSLQRSIEKLVHIRCSNYKEDYIKRRILSRMRLTGNDDYGAYHKYLLANSQEVELLKSALTINVTKFFRDTEVFDLIRRDIFPNLLNQRKTVRIWCAGCASGEEPYSLAMIMHDLTALKSDTTVTIYATDIDKEVLKKAIDGIYDKKALENLSEPQIRKHFTPRDDGKFEVKPHLKGMIKFRYHDLMSGIPIARYLDAISCRNVTIYFSEKQKNDLNVMFHKALANGGFYIMGKTEYLGRDVENLFLPYNMMQKVMVRRD
jgi:chemotaxis protein methyltransferase CheR